MKKKWHRFVACLVALVVVCICPGAAVRAGGAGGEEAGVVEYLSTSGPVVVKDTTEHYLQLDAVFQYQGNETVVMLTEIWSAMLKVQRSNTRIG